MSLATHAHFDLPERQAAFVGLLVTPLVTRARDRVLHALVTTQRRRLDQWARRAGYRITSVGGAYRLRRTPLAGSVAVPAGAGAPRRELVLALVVAAALEDQPTDAITLQGISDATRGLTAQAGLAEYDPDRRAHRLMLVRAVDRLARLGVLEPRTNREDLVRVWEDDGSGVGAGYGIDRDALVLLVDPHDLDLALAGEAEAAPERADTRGPRLLRQLVETQALTVADLDADDAAYLIGQRARLAHHAAEMTGGVVEIRSDAMVLVLGSEGPYSAAATLPFPAVSARDWVALSLLDDAAGASVPHPHRPGFRRCPAETVARLAEELHARAGHRLTIELKESPEVVRAVAAQCLVDAGLLDLDAGDWVLRPAAARYRDATLHLPRDGAGRGEAGDPAGPGDPPVSAQDTLFGELT